MLFLLWYLVTKNYKLKNIEKIIITSFKEYLKPFNNILKSLKNFIIDNLKNFKTKLKNFKNKLRGFNLHSFLKKTVLNWHDTLVRKGDTNKNLKKFCMKNMHNKYLIPLYYKYGKLRAKVKKNNGIVKTFYNILLKKTTKIINKFIKKPIILKKTPMLFNKLLKKIKKIKQKKFKQHFIIFLKKQVQSNFSKKSIKYILIFIYVFIVFFIFYKLNFNNYLYMSYKFYAILLLLYIYITFIHLSKYYFFNKYTSVIQRFWKRSFSIFWSLEITLFLIYIYLMLISPAEYSFNSYNHKEFNNSLLNTYNSYYSYIYTFVILFLTSMLLHTIFLKKKKQINFIIVSFILTLLTYIYILYFEFYKYYFINNWYNFSINDFSVKNKGTCMSYANLNINFLNNSIFFKKSNNNVMWSRTYNHFLTIIIVLKFWHLIFIITFFLFLIIKYLNTSKIHFDTLGANYQNSLFVFLFYLITYLTFLKKNLYFLITFLHKSCITTINFKNVFVYYYYEFYIFIINIINDFFNLIF